MSKLTNVQVQDFLNDFEAKSEICLLEEGKEKDELLQIAEAKGMKIKGSRDLAIFKTIYAFIDLPNSNGAILPKKELLKVLPQIIGKPVNVNHQRNFCVGHYIDYRYREKENQVIAYGVFYKSYFPREWEAAQNLFRKKKLSSSFEIWSPKENRKENKDGTYELQKMEIAGGALIFEDEENQPAFKDAKVLDLAKEDLEKMELVYASKYKEDEIITCEKGKCKVEKSDEEKKTDDTDIKEEEKQLPQTSQITCSNCGEKFEISGLDVHVKCPKCFAILNKKGEMIYPPQIKDFKILCPACKVSNWLILSNKEDKSRIRCMNCSKEYDLTFKKDKSSEALDKLTFLYSGTARCYQCGTSIVFEGSSKFKTREFTCPKCGLQFSYNISKSESYRTIASIQEIEVKSDKEIVKSNEGGKTMELDKKQVEETKVEKAEEKKDEGLWVKEKKEESVETESTDKSANESSEEEKAPEAEENKVEETTVEEPKAEDKIEEKVEEVKAEENTEDALPTDMEFEQQFENKEDEYEITISKLVELAKLDDKIKDLETSQNVTCECLKCGKKLTTSEHCNTIKCPECGGEMRRTDRPGSGRPDKSPNANKAKTITYQERKNLPDSMFAVVVEVKNKRTGKMRKIRKYPIHDKAHVRNALSRLGQSAAQETLKKLGVSIEAVRRKILARARTLGMKDLLARYKATREKVTLYKEGINKLANQLVKARKSIDLYKAEAKKILQRQEELGDYAKNLTDEDILNDDKFEKAKLEKENALLKASQHKDDDIVGGQKEDNNYYAKKRAEINRYAFGE